MKLWYSAAKVLAASAGGFAFIVVALLAMGFGTWAIQHGVSPARIGAIAVLAVLVCPLCLVALKMDMR